MKNGALRATLRDTGFSYWQGRGSHEVWAHPYQPACRIVLRVRNGSDARPLRVTRVRQVCRGVRAHHRRRMKSEMIAQKKRQTWSTTLKEK